MTLIVVVLFSDLVVFIRVWPSIIGNWCLLCRSWWDWESRLPTLAKQVEGLNASERGSCV